MKTNQKTVDLNDTYFPVTNRATFTSGSCRCSSSLHKHIVLFSGMFTWSSPGLSRFTSIWKRQTEPLHTRWTLKTHSWHMVHSSEGRKKSWIQQIMEKNSNLVFGRNSPEECNNNNKKVTCSVAADVFWTLDEFSDPLWLCVDQFRVAVDSGDFREIGSWRWKQTVRQNGRRGRLPLMEYLSQHSQNGFCPSFLSRGNHSWY